MAQTRILGAVARVAICSFFALGGSLEAQFVTDSVKSDTLLLRNGDLLTGEFRELERGIVSYKTDAMSTINVKWSRVLTAKTDKEFEIHLSTGERWIGSLAPTDPGFVTIRAVSDTFDTAMGRIVEMQRLKSSFWNRLDGSLDLGFDFTQQNKKVDINVRGDVEYVANRNRFNLRFTESVSRQDSASDITRSEIALGFTREMPNVWFLGFFASAEQNSQLSLDLRGTLGAGPGAYLVWTSRLSLATALALQFTRERFTGEETRTTVPLGLLTDFQFFNWSGLSTDVSARLTIQPVLNNSGRWQITLYANLRQEVLSNFYLTVGVNEVFDSEPPAVDANRNDLSITTSLGWTF